jgi:Trk-type K+ transport system membrane component
VTEFRPALYIVGFLLLALGAAMLVPAVVDFAVDDIDWHLFGLDPVTALSGAANAIGNVGPGLGPLIGPSGNFSSLPDGAKWVLAAGMLLGRLEFVTVFALLTHAFWRD